MDDFFQAISHKVIIKPTLNQNHNGKPQHFENYSLFIRLLALVLLYMGHSGPPVDLDKSKLYGQFL